ncbi:MAG: hemerythrin family protein [Magnetococcales bacterium]|nr:hemerythrin family protein [Magnetococcales bacterium]
MNNLVIQYKDQQLTFKKDLKIGVEQIDEQHHTLFRLTYEVSQLLNNTPSKEDIELRALELEAYVQEHLGFEETLLSKNGFKNFSSHKKLHDEFTKTARELRAKISTSEGDSFQKAASELFDILSNWLVEHIMAEDRNAKEYMDPKEHDVQPRPPRIKATDNVVVELSDTNKVAGLISNVSPKSILITLTEPAPKWLSQDSKVNLHLIPLEENGNLNCRVVRCTSGHSLVVALDQELTINQIATLIKG